MLELHIKKIKKLFKENWTELNLYILLLPLMFAGGIVYFLLSDTVLNMEGMSREYFKGILENVAFYILIPALIISYLRSCIERSLFFLWFTFVIGSLICREVHWDWTGSGVFVLLIILMVIAYFAYDKLRPQITSSVFINLFIIAILSYFISAMILDQNWGRIPKTFRSDIKFRKSLEEFMEILGHSLIALTVLLTPVLKRKKDISGD